MELREQTYCAVRMMVHLSQEGRKTKEEEISALHVDEGVFDEIVEVLVNAGWIDVSDGQEQTYGLCAAPQEINLFQIMLLMEGSMGIGPDRGRTEENCVDDEQFVIADVYQNCRDFTKSYFSGITLSDLTA